MMSPPISVLVVDDHPLLRQGVVNSLSLEPDIHVIGQANSGEMAVQLIRDLKPMVAVVDINLPGINGQQVARMVSQEKLPTRIVLLTAYDDISQKIQGFSAGAAAYCTKDIQPELIVDVVRAVAAGKYVVDGQKVDAGWMERWLKANLDRSSQPESGILEQSESLSAREMEILICVANGMSNKEIALHLGISHQTVKNHVTAVLRKIGVDDRTQATIYAIQRGWVRLQKP